MFAKRLAQVSASATLKVAAEAERLIQLRERLRVGIMTRAPDVHVNGSMIKRLPGNLNLGFYGVKGEALLLAMKDIAVSSGSACTTANLAPSHVLKALGLDDELADASIRFGLGRFTTVDEIDYAIDHVVDNVQRLRALSPRWEMHQASRGAS